MLISYNWLQSYFDKKLPAPDELSALFSRHVFEVESVLPKKGDHVFDVKILPDRAHYLLSHSGVAREIRAITGLSLRAPENAGGGGIESSDDITIPDVKIEEKDFCRRYMARRVEGIDSVATPAWVTERLSAIGQKSVNPLVDAVNYVMFDIGQPLHIFDADKTKGSIVIRLAKDGEKITTLTGEEIILTKDDLVIADDDGVIGIAGVKGGERAEVTPSTKNLIIESANFHPASVRRTATRLNLRTDASKRFENEITPAKAEEGMSAVNSVIKKFCPQAVFSGLRDEYPAPVSPWHVPLSIASISDILGESVTGDEARDLLGRMDIVVSEDKGELVAIPPLDRLDIIIPEDIADEVGRLRGYENLASTMPPELGVKEVTDKEFFYAEKAKNILAEKGYSEVLLYSLVPKGFWNIAKPLSKGKSALREGLSTNLLESLKLNTLNADLLGLDRVKIFEYGRVFPSSGEEAHIALAVSKGKKNDDERADDIIRGDFVSLGEGLGVSLEPETSGGLYGTVGEVNFSKTFKMLPDEIALKSLNFSKLSKDARYMAFSLYPFITRDVAIFINSEDDKFSVENILRRESGDLLVSLRLFDEFKKDGKLSLAFRLVFQSHERTLSDAEINKTMERVYASLRSANANWEVR
ncbi:MAG TPA: phenylalanine--tRNA ligase subunit beta [Candidatus Paceibacterota bacterium]